MGGLFSAGLEMLLDGQLRYTREGTQCFLRLQNFAPQGDFQEVGVPFTPTGTALAQSGFTDLFIDPPPAVTQISEHDIGLSAGKLMFGAHRFLVSDTFIENQREQYPNILDQFDVWRNWDGQTPVIGIIYNNRLFSIEDINRRTFAGRTISWLLTANATEVMISNPSDNQVEP